ncbi:MAG: ankyrin-3-like [Ramlibacter sp.]|nr:ankyrin-3-like [Ramlibacter sp.]MDB5913802.1 ankyrin-3-like [Ramlibacter sp.]
MALCALLAIAAQAQAYQVTQPGPTGFRMARSAETAAAIARTKTQPNTLERAVWTQDRELTHVLLAAGADPNARSGGKSELIVAAAMQGDPVIIEDLVSHGANVNAGGETGSPLYWAARQGNLEAVRTLLARGANVKYQAPDGGTALHSTLGDSNDVKIAELLLDQGADLEARKSGMTPLLMASLFGRVEWVRLFLQRGAQVDAKNPYGQTPLAVSATFGRAPEIERLLREAGAR